MRRLTLSERSINQLFPYVIFDEPYMNDKGTVYYFNNNIVMIRYNRKYTNKFIDKGVVTPQYGVKLIVDGCLLYHTCRFTVRQIREILTMIKFKDYGEGI